MHAGDSVEVVVEGRPVTLPVAGVFRDLVQHRDESWCSLGPILQEQRTGGPPPPVMLTDQDLLIDTYTGVGGTTSFVRWEYAPPASGWTLADASRTITQLQGVAATSTTAHRSAQLA